MVFIRKEKRSRKIQVPSLPKELKWCEKYFDESLGKLPAYIYSLNKNAYSLFFRLPFYRGIEEKPIYAVWYIILINEGKNLGNVSFAIVANNKQELNLEKVKEVIYEVTYDTRRKYHSKNPKPKSLQTVDDEWYMSIFNKLDGLMYKIYKNDMRNSLLSVCSNPVGAKGRVKEFSDDLFK